MSLAIGARPVPRPAVAAHARAGAAASPAPRQCADAAAAMMPSRGVPPQCWPQAQSVLLPAMVSVLLPARPAPAGDEVAVGSDCGCWPGCGVLGQVGMPLGLRALPSWQPAADMPCWVIPGQESLWKQWPDGLSHSCAVQLWGWACGAEGAACSCRPGCVHLWAWGVRRPAAAGLGGGVGRWDRGGCQGRLVAAGWGG